MRRGFEALALDASALAVLSALLPIACEGGSIQDLDTRVVGGGAGSVIGGEPTGYEIWRGVVSVEGDVACTGTLINPKVVLTAAHCLYYPDYGIDVTDAPDTIQIKGGPTDGDLTAYATSQDIALYPGWDGTLWFDEVDMALVLLEEPIVEIESYPVRQEPEPEVGADGIVVGYGLFDGSDAYSGGVHRWGATKVLGYQNKFIEGGGETGFCHGDSGGPLFTEQGGEWAVSGVVSFVTDAECDPASGNFYTNVVMQREWISGVMEAWTGEGLPADDTDTASETDSDSETDTGGIDDSDTGGDADTGTDSVPDVDGGSDERPGHASGEACGCSSIGAKSDLDLWSLLSVLL
jgi:hypothetical protein